MGYFYTDFQVLNPFRSAVPKGFYDPIKHHTGTDYACPVGTPLSLPEELTVELVAKQTEMGLVLYLRDKGDNILVFAHLSEVDVKIGDELNRNKIFAKSGNSGSRTTGAHLHSELISLIPTHGLEFMTRTLQGFSGYNINPHEYFTALPGEEPHYSDEAMNRLVEQKKIVFKRPPDQSVKWGDFAVLLDRLYQDKFNL